MSSSVQRKRIRKSPEARRAEIVETAAAVALAEGLECLTLRRIADELAVRPGLISHYFPSVEDLVAEAFGTAAGAELEVLLPAGAQAPTATAAATGPAGAATGPAELTGPGGAGAGVGAGADASTATERLARFFGRTSGEAYDAISRLWINARHLSRYRPLLRDRVAEQEAAWRGRLVEVIREGVEHGEFRTRDPYVTAIQILVVLDGLGAHANTEDRDRPEAVTRMAVTTAERELDLPHGALTRDA
ncbi:TetR/AcrR family transcriptional regulator [Streptomyces virginiae]|uniref:TetR/AcrR family transcriptional regulator n=1 Tax=Streptomyces virginiae TaxID=1961 RepID=UPI0035E1976E